jgi:hypothetical protein
MSGQEDVLLFSLSLLIKYCCDVGFELDPHNDHPGALSWHHALQQTPVSTLKGVFPSLFFLVIVKFT